MCKTSSLESKKIRLSSKGTQKWLDIECYEDTLALIDTLQTEYKYEVLAVELTKDAVKYNATKYKYPTAFVFGNEKHGISEDVINKCDNAVYIEMLGMGNSINVSNCASIIIADAINKYIKK